MTEKIILFGDISTWQDSPDIEGHIDFEKMKTQSDYVVIRIGQGDWKDADFDRNWAGAKAAGLRRGGYWYYDNRIDPNVQAANLAQYLGDDLGEGMIFADFEDRDPGPHIGWQKWYTFLVKLQEALPTKKLGIYTAPSYWKEYTIAKNIPAASLQWFRQFGLWIANTQVDAPYIPEPWGVNGAGEYLAWQYTWVGDGTAWGVESKGIDLNKMHEEDAEIIFGDAQVDPPVDPPADPCADCPDNCTQIAQGKVVMDDLRIRSAPSVNSFILGEFWNNGSEIEIIQERYDDDGNHWVQFTAWAAAEYSGNTLIELSGEVPEPPAIPNIFPPTGIQQLYTVPDDGFQYVQLPNDWQRPDWDWKSRASAQPRPQTVPLQYNKKEEWYPMSEAWQYWLRDLMAYCSQHFDDVRLETEYLKHIANRHIYTDRHAPQNNCVEYVYNSHDASEGDKCGGITPYSWKGSISCGGNIARVVRDDGKHLWLDALNPYEAPPALADVVEDRALLHFANEIWRDRFDDGTYKVTHFGNGRGVDEEKHGTLAPLFGIPRPELGIDTPVRPVLKSLIVNERYNGYLQPRQQYQVVNLSRWHE